ncbi:hypothetical protein GCM10010156_24470 [Planobispora rosea]|uniref:Uncharacterized protein n=1 Tax=Planobispora rosea TaxID=35762 RepID=A0A8J3RWY1_PLARO|nr:hypothetical protein [Planobispora rosea]GGS64481.1 hypothetical protein GCM10010156_24470 [Planobispora rosea]GIH84611.1 hypothetical protein Pro02_30190 [Planobispora rosea]
MKYWALAAGAALAVSAALPAQAATPAQSPAQSGAPAPLTGQGVYLSYGNDVRVLKSDGRPVWGSRAASFTGQFSASPDGRKVAWIDGKGRLHVSSATAGKTVDKIVARGAAYGGPCLTPAWSADSRRIAFPTAAAGGSGNQERTTVAAVGADGKGLSTLGTTLGPCHLTWSADGRALAGYAGDTTGVHLLATGSRTSTRVPGIKLANHVESLSPDGRRVVVNAIGANANAGDGSWPLSFTPSIHDTRTGKKITIPVKGRLLGARYLRDGRLVVRVAGKPGNTLVVLDSSGKTLQRLSEKAGVRNLGLLQILG